MQLSGLGFRNKLMLHYVVHKCRLIDNPEHFDSIFVVPTNASPKWTDSCRPNSCPAAVPKGRFAIVSGRLRRIGMICPQELFASQQISFRDFFGTNPTKYAEAVRQFNYSDLINMAGYSFHTGSCGHFAIALLLLPKLESFARAR